jgi:hypothetical protein
MNNYQKIYKQRIEKLYQYCKTEREIEMLSQIKDSIDYLKEPHSLITIIDKKVDVRGMLGEVKKYPLHWLFDVTRQENIDVQRETESISLVSPIPLKGKQGLESTWDSHDYEETVLYDFYPEIMSFLESFPEKVARVSIIRLLGQVYSHIDYGEYYRNRKRYHLCLEGEYEYHVLDTVETISAGTLFYFDNDYPHWSINKGSVPRISIVFDTEPKI